MRERPTIEKHETAGHDRHTGEMDDPVQRLLFDKTTGGNHTEKTVEYAPDCREDHARTAYPLRARQGHKSNRDRRKAYWKTPCQGQDREPAVFHQIYPVEALEQKNGGTDLQQDLDRSMRNERDAEEPDE